MRFSRTLGLVLSLLVGVAVIAETEPTWAQQLRTLPAKGKRAQLQGYQNPFVYFSDATLRLAPGALIYDASNRTILPNALPAGADVVYTTDATGNVMRIYLLTSDERQKLDQTGR
jgi:hypothetical protein